MPISTLIGFGWKGAFADAGTSLVQKAPTNRFDCIINIDHRREALVVS